MKVIASQFNLEAFYDRLKSAGRLLLMLDYDGTLAPFTTERERAVPYPEIKDTLLSLLDSNRTRVVVISGRTVDMLKQLIDSPSLPELWGCHGLERFTREGEYYIVELSDEIRNKLAELYNWTAQTGLVNVCEFKPSGAAFHWRGLPSETAEKIRQTVVERWHNVAESSNLELYEFDGGVEIRVVGTNKATPVSQLLEESDNDTPAAYLGDDLTDEDAFGAIKGRGLGVLVRNELRETQADIWISPPHELNDFLKRWL